MAKKSIILVGGGGHCKAAIDVIESDQKYTITGILDVADKVGSTVLGYPIIGTNQQISELASPDVFFIITVGQIKTDTLRKTLFDELKKQHAQIATIISPTAYVSKYAIIGEGSIVMHHATINAGAILGNNNLINTASNVEHDVRIGDNCHLSTHSVINGDCRLGSGVFVGSNSVVVQGINLADHVIIGAGTVVHKSINEPGVYVGVPFKRVK